MPNFFDSFDPTFFRNLMVAMGVSQKRANLNWHLNTFARKRFQIRGHYGEILDSDRGAGQGDSWSLIQAILITTVQMDYLSAQYPSYA